MNTGFFNPVMLDLLYNNMSDLVFFMKVEKEGPSFHYVFANDAALKVTGLKDIFGKTFEDLLLVERAIFFQNQYQKVFTEGQTVQFEESVETQNGIFIGETILSPFFDESGECSHILGISRNVTEQRPQERKLKENLNLIEDISASYAFNTREQR